MGGSLLSLRGSRTRHPQRKVEGRAALRCSSGFPSWEARHASVACSPRNLASLVRNQTGWLMAACALGILVLPLSGRPGAVWKQLPRSTPDLTPTPMGSAHLRFGGDGA